MAAAFIVPTHEQLTMLVVPTYHETVKERDMLIETQAALNVEIDALIEQFHGKRTKQ